MRKAVGVDGAKFGIAVAAPAPDLGDGAGQFGIAVAIAQQGRARSWPCVANRQVYSLPSVERRAREQSLQKACVTLEITPISPPPST